MIVKLSGQDWTWDKSQCIKWYWGTLIAQLRPDDMKKAVNGLDGNSGGVISCSLRKFSNYNHALSHASNANVHKKPIALDADKGGTAAATHDWGFVIEYKNGGGLLLSPTWSNTTVSVRQWPYFQQLAIPCNGKGGSDGPGTYSKYKKAGVCAIFKFDGNKGKDLPPKRSEGNNAVAK